jgi:hypothetical protein
MATIKTPVCRVCQQPGEVQVDDGQAQALAQGHPAALVLPDRDKLIQDQVDHGIHPACFLAHLEKIHADTSHYDGMGEIDS